MSYNGPVSCPDEDCLNDVIYDDLSCSSGAGLEQVTKIDQAFFDALNARFDQLSNAICCVAGSGQTFRQQVGSFNIRGTDTTSATEVFAEISTKLFDEHNPDAIYSLASDRINILKDCITTAHIQNSFEQGGGIGVARSNIVWSTYTVGSQEQFPNYENVNAPFPPIEKLENYSNGRFMPAGSFIQIAGVSDGSAVLNFGESSWTFIGTDLELV